MAVEDDQRKRDFTNTRESPPRSPDADPRAQRPDDYLRPLELFQKPMFRFLGTKVDDKRHVLFDGGHIPIRLAPVKPTLEWLDRYLGPVTGN